MHQCQGHLCNKCQSYPMQLLITLSDFVRIAPRIPKDLLTDESLHIYKHVPSATQTDGPAPTTSDDTIADFGLMNMLADSWVGIGASVALYANVAAGVTPGCGLADYYPIYHGLSTCPEEKKFDFFTSLMWNGHFTKHCMNTHCWPSCIQPCISTITHKLTSSSANLVEPVPVWVARAVSAVTRVWSLTGFPAWTLAYDHGHSPLNRGPIYHHTFTCKYKYEDTVSYILKWLQKTKKWTDWGAVSCKSPIFLYQSNIWTKKESLSVMMNS